MQNILIVEDDLEQLNSLTKVIQDTYPTWSVFATTDYDTAYFQINESISLSNKFSLFLFDVQLSSNKNNRDGFKLAEYLRTIPEYYKTPLLFLTSVSDDNHYALHNFHCYNYISKPYTGNDILQQIQHMLLTGYIENDRLIIKDTSRVIHKIMPSEIKYIQAQSNKLVIHINNTIITTRYYTLENIIDYIKSDCIRCHNSYIVNIKYANNYDPINHCILIDKHSVKVSKHYAKEIKELMQKG